MLQFFLLVNKQGQTRLSQYYENVPLDKRINMEGEIVRKCLSRTDSQCFFLEYMSYKIVYRRYASLFFIVGVDSTENELGILEFIHAYVETLDSNFENVVCVYLYHHSFPISPFLPSPFFPHFLSLLLLPLSPHPLHFPPSSHND
eukprot:Phypoly_transcript_17636.p1 GENE.Phypoly_transcript_17636~~Phypoly_transcript_17636.p1  ORF type:complete len:145 (-),score=5.57 Phypoly_transcript_17636:230-664(-)